METQNDWFALEIIAVSEASEAVEFALNELAALGTEINHLGKDKPKETLCIVGYFNEKPGSETVRIELTEALRIYGFDQTAIKNLTWREVENRDWLAEWKKHWQPTRTGKFIVAPTWNDIAEETFQNREIIIRIDPEMAFGTGTHETTRLCLQAIEENYTSEMGFLDVGTGTGILAIAAAKLRVQNSKFKVQDSKFEVQSNETANQNSSAQAKENSNLEPETLNLESVNSKSISACDTDETSVEIAVKNAGLNQIAQEINFYVGSIDENTADFDFVCANLTADVILPLLPLLVGKAVKKLVLSGILAEQETSVTEKLRELGISNFKIQIDGEWISILIDNG